jgi:hypothetical protein
MQLLQAIAHRKDDFRQTRAFMEGTNPDLLNRGRNFQSMQSCASLKSSHNSQAAVSGKYHFAQARAILKGRKPYLLN